ncbi:MAG TPA: gluconeogenesis factor YvcK family protein [Candidatus Nanoarchaeia archaeon]|nr:gluconeogenesis factor YvcK family protein [Candidatus Nanoarchaeia archaeon]
MQKIVVIGGGTGSYTVLRGLKKYDVELTAVFNMMDSGGSAGRLRDEFGFLPAGDVRRGLIALSPETSMLRKLFEYRFSKGQGLEGHNFGNLFLTALRDITGSDVQAIEDAGKILNIKGRVLPVTTTDCHVGAILENGQVIVSEVNLLIPKHDPRLRVKKVFLMPKAKAYKPAVESILKANKVVIAPGGLHYSLLPSILVSGVKDALKKSRADKIYVCNIMTQYGDSTGFKASDFVKEMEKYLGKGVIDYVICNNKRPSAKLIQEYGKEKAEYVEPDIVSKKFRVIKTDLLDNIHLARHNPDKLAKTIMNIK